MAYGAGLIAARKFGAREIVDPCPYVRGTIEDIFKKYQGLGPLLPAMGYSLAQRDELRETIGAVECDTVIIGTPIGLKGLLNLQKEIVRVGYEIEECENTLLRGYIEEFVNEATKS